MTMSSERGRTRSSLQSHRFYLLLASVLIIHLVCYQAAAPLRQHRALAPAVAPLFRRSLSTAFAELKRNSSAPAVPTPSPPHSPPESAALLNYLALYDRASHSAKPFVFSAMLLWLTFLFAFVGITASDFFCPNLSTIADRLGLSESVAGVTFLAWSNGSPDVFSTFSALRAHSGSLAVGELLGAASFITMVVAGTMCLIKPFKVSAHTFLRDVGFFTLAVMFTLKILWDGQIYKSEAAGMVGLYGIYVAFVAVQSWWHARRERSRELLRLARDEYAEESMEYHDEPQTPDTPSEQRHASKSRASSGATTPNGYPFPDLPFPGLIPTHPHSHGPLDDETFFDLSERGIPVTLTRRRSGSATTHASPLVRRPNLKSAVRPSLLGAIEFRDVVNSLRADSSARTLAVFGGGMGDDRHMHASAVGSESGTSSSLHHHKRSSSHTGAVAPHSNPTSPSVEGRPRGKSVYDAGAHGWASSEGGPWNDAEEDEEEVLRDGAPGQLIDLSRGVEDPWRGAAREPLQVRIPSLHSRNSSSTLSPMHRSKSDPIRPPIRRVPSILLTTDAGEEETVLAAPSSPNPSARSLANRQRLKIVKAVFLALFPSLQDFKEKSYLGRATAILCVPAILLLNLTLPVVDDQQDDCDSIEEKERHCEEEEGGSYRDDYETPASRGLLIDHTLPQSVQEADREARTTRKAIAHEFHSNVVPHPTFGDLTQEAAVDLHGVDRSLLSQAERGETTLMTEEEEQEQSKRTALNLNGYLLTADVPVEADVLIRWLTAVQCTLAPIFCSTALFIDDLQWWYPLAALGVGLSMATLAFCTFKDNRHPGRIVLCFVGFFVAMVWILMIVNEVVGVLQAVGHIFGLSDAILGLTVFAMGNSLGDLVANATVARMGFPSMAIAACFGGPMLNILLGIGLSGFYMIYQNQGQPYHVEIGRTLMVSGVGLLVVLISTMIIVPLNGYWMNRRLGAGLIGAYCVVLATNVAVEIWW